MAISYSEYLEKITEEITKAQKPLQEMAELNVKTLQSFNYLKPEDLTRIKKPDELFEKQLSLTIENGQKALEYMKQSFQIMEKMTQTFQESKK